jgi:hypothetical protein
VDARDELSRSVSQLDHLARVVKLAAEVSHDIDPRPVAKPRCVGADRESPTVRQRHAGRKSESNGPFETPAVQIDVEGPAVVELDEFVPWILAEWMEMHLADDDVVAARLRRRRRADDERCGEAAQNPRPTRPVAA